jgi:DNA polymerase-1
VAAGELEHLKAIVADAMGRAFGLSIPLEVSMGTGHSWAEAAH